MREKLSEIFPIIDPDYLTMKRLARRLLKMGLGHDGAIMAFIYAVQSVEDEYEAD